MLTPRGAADPSSSDAGLSLVEVMVAMAVFAIGSLSLLTVLSSSTGGTFDNRARVTAANLAAADVDEARSTNYYDLAVGTAPTRTVTVDGRAYSVVREVAVTMASGTAGTSSCVTSGSSRQLHKRISTSVTTDFRGRTKPVRADTIVKAPVFDPNSPNGAIGFLVMDRTGQPLPGLAVAVPEKSRTTDSNGCAFLDQLAPGAYTVTVTRSGSVTREGRTSLTKTVTVNPGQVTADSMRVDAGITVTVKAKAFTGSDPSPLPSTGQPWRMPSQKAMLTAPDRTMSTALTLLDRKTLTGSDLVWTAYPSPGGYDAHIGACSVMHHFDSEPSTSPVFDLPFSPVTVQLKSGNDQLARSKSVTATWNPTSTHPAPCTERLTWAVTTSSGCGGTADLNGNSCRLDLAVPAGSWTVNVSGSDGASVAPVTGSKTVSVGTRASAQYVDIQVTSS